MGEREEELVLEVLRSGRLSLGPTIDRFEELVAERVGAPYAAAVSSGTAGLHMLCHIVGLGSGDEAITSPVSFVASANCFIFEGATPLFADVDPRTLNLDPAAVEAAITERTKAVVAVDMFGYPCELDELRALCERHGLALIEDSAEALGAEYKGTPLGGHGPPAVFGFYPNKQIATGEGGVVVTHSEEQWQLLRSLRNQGRDRDGTWLRHVRLGYKYRLDELSAAVGVAQIERLAELRSGRARVVAGYERALGGHDWLTLPRAGAGEEVDWFVYVIRLHPEIDRDGLIGRLASVGVASRPYFTPLHLQPLYRELFGFQPGDVPVTERVAASTLALPFSSRLADEDVQYVSDALVDAVQARA